MVPRNVPSRNQIRAPDRPPQPPPTPRPPPARGGVGGGAAAPGAVVRRACRARRRRRRLPRRTPRRTKKPPVPSADGTGGMNERRCAPGRWTAAPQRDAAARETPRRRASWRAARRAACSASTCAAKSGRSAIQRRMVVRPILSARAANVIDAPLRIALRSACARAGSKTPPQDRGVDNCRKLSFFSRTYEKAVVRLARLHRRIRTIRRDFLHKVATGPAKARPVLVAEDLNVRGLARNGSLSRAILDVGWGAFRRMLEYKCAWYGAVLFIAPRYFPSTKRCSRCGWVGPALPLSQRVFHCEACRLKVDRDLNAACNLREYGLTHLTGSTGSSSGSDACGDPSGGGTARGGRSTSHGSMKQEAARHEFHPSW